MKSNWGKFYGVGVGPGDPDFLTVRAVEVLNKVDIVAIPHSRLDRESVAWDIAKKHCHKDIKLLELEMPMTENHSVLEKAWIEGSQQIFEQLKEGYSVAFVTLGDPSLYSTYSYLLNYLVNFVPQELIETIPGVTSMSAAAARINMPLAIGNEPLLILPSSEDINNFLDFPNIVLLKISRNYEKVLNTLNKTDKKFTLLSRLGQTGEKILHQPQINKEQEKVDYLSLLIVKKDK